MKLNNNKIALSTNDHGEIESIKYDDVEILHDGKQWWQKMYPMIWPVIGVSNNFVVEEVNYDIPKHGFWNKMEWQTIIENNKIVQLATHTPDKEYPFTIDIQNKIWIENDSIFIKTIFANLGKEEAYFHFGHHPAFKIDNHTTLITDKDYKKILMDGKYKNEVVQNEELMKMKFGIDYDTIVSKDVEEVNESIIYKDLKISVISKDFDNVQVWKPKDAKFVCIEPWQGWTDNEYDSPKDAKEKLGIVNLKSGAVEEFQIEINIKKTRLN